MIGLVPRPQNTLVISVSVRKDVAKMGISTYGISAIMVVIRNTGLLKNIIIAPFGLLLLLCRERL